MLSLKCINQIINGLKMSIKLFVASYIALKMLQGFVQRIKFIPSFGSLEQLSSKGQCIDKGLQFVAI